MYFVCDSLVLFPFPVCASLRHLLAVSHNVCPPLLGTADLLSVKIVKMLELNCETWRGRGCACSAPAPTRAGGGGDEAEPVAHRSCGRTQASAA